MAGEKNFENRLKEWLEAEGIYPLGEPVDHMSAPPVSYTHPTLPTIHPV